MVDSPSTLEEVLLAAAEILSKGDGISCVYQLLADVATRRELSDAWLVLGPVGGTVHEARTAPQLFGLGGAAATPETARSLLGRPPGIYGEPSELDSLTSRVMAAMCASTLRAAVASLRSAVDLASGLSSTAMIEASVARAAASGARYGWSSTLLLLATSGTSSQEQRWLALAAALRQALRTGDEAGVAAPGVALVILGNAGPEAVRPFVARVRTALSADGWSDVDLHAATARTPEETVDPSELMHLARERLAGARAASAGVSGAEPSPTHDTASAVELELRMLPGVVCVGMGTPVVVVARSTSEPLYDQALHLILRHLPEASLRLLGLSDSSVEAPASGFASPPDTPLRRGLGGIGGNGGNGGNGGSWVSASRGMSATAPGGTQPASGAERVALVSATFDDTHGVSEVSLALGAARGVGRAFAGPLAGGAQATLNALSALSIEVPFYLVSAERAHGAPGRPVVVVLTPTRTGAERDTGTVERLGIASDPEDVVATSRATLGALNRHLAKFSTAP